MCVGCFLDEKEKAIKLESKLKEAKEYAVKNQVMVIVYNDEVGQPQFIHADKAAELNIKGQYVSPLRPYADGSFY